MSKSTQYNTNISYVKKYKSKIGMLEVEIFQWSMKISTYINQSTEDIYTYNSKITKCTN